MCGSPGLPVVLALSLIDRWIRQAQMWEKDRLHANSNPASVPAFL